METRNRTVAVVDDDDSVLKAIRRLLVAVGFDTVAFHRGQDFLDFVSRDSVGCVVLDIRMPEMDGLEVADRLKSFDRLIPVVFLSAYLETISANRITGGEPWPWSRNLPANAACWKP